MGMTLVLIGMAFTLGVLVAGVVLMGKGGKANETFGTRLMMFRVLFQALTVIALFIIFVVLKKGGA